MSLAISPPPQSTQSMQAVAAPAPAPAPASTTGKRVQGGTPVSERKKKARHESELTHEQVAMVERYIREVQGADMNTLCNVKVPSVSITKYVSTFRLKAAQFLNIGNPGEFTFTSLITALVRFPKSLCRTIEEAWDNKKPRDEDLPLKCCWVKDHRLFVIKPLFEYYLNELWRKVTTGDNTIDSNMKANKFMCCRVYSLYHTELGIYHPPAKFLKELHRSDPKTFPPVDEEYIRSMVGIRGKGHVCECQAPQLFGALDSRSTTNIMAAAAVLGTTPTTVAAAMVDQHHHHQPAVPDVGVLPTAAAAPIQLPVRMQRPSQENDEKWAMITALTKLPIYISGQDVKAYRKAIEISQIELADLEF